jgi:internalin A
MSGREKPTAGEKAKEIADDAGQAVSRIGRSIWGKVKDVAEATDLDLAGKATVDALGKVKDYVKLEKLNLSHNPLLKDADLRSLVSVKTLQHLDLGFNPGLTDAGLAHISGNRNLKHLNLENTLITGVAFSAMPALPIVNLVLKNADRLGVPQLAHLSKFTDLQRLDLSQNAQITDAALPHLKRLTGLKDLDLRGTSLSQTAVAELQRALPNARIRK